MWTIGWKVIFRMNQESALAKAIKLELKSGAIQTIYIKTSA